MSAVGDGGSGPPGVLRVGGGVADVTLGPPAGAPPHDADRPVDHGEWSAEALRARFDANEPFTVGLEEEVLLVEAGSGRVVPRAAQVVATAADPAIKTELPACQVEVVTNPHRTVADAVRELAAGRRALLGACPAGVRPMAAAVHPSTGAEAPIAASTRATGLVEEYGHIARRQLVGALQVHVAVGRADATLAVFNGLRGLLPELAALAAAAPFNEGRDTGLASVRPLIAGQLPRQGVPPIIPSWDALADDLSWGARSGAVRDPSRWWWELRPHVDHGTREVRVPDVQPTIAAAGAVASVVRALVVHLTRRAIDGGPVGAAPTWRIAENRWAALRDGVHGQLADLETGERQPTARRLHDLIDEIEPCSLGGLDAARALIGHPAADTLRAVGINGAVAWLTEAYREGISIPPVPSARVQG